MARVGRKKQTLDAWTHLAFKIVCCLSKHSSVTKVPDSEQDTSRPGLDYVLAVTASQAFSAPTTVKHTNGLMAYII